MIQKYISRDREYCCCFINIDAVPLLHFHPFPLSPRRFHICSLLHKKLIPKPEITQWLEYFLDWSFFELPQRLRLKFRLFKYFAGCRAK